MSVKLYFGRKRVYGNVASDTDWYNLSRWVEKLPNRFFPNLTHLVYYGFSRNVSMLVNELIEANKKYKSNDLTVVLVIVNMIRYMNLNRNADITIVSGGLFPEPQKNPPIRR